MEKTIRNHLKKSIRHFAFAGTLLFSLAAPFAAIAAETPLWEGAEVSQAQKQASERLLSETGSPEKAAEKAMNAGWESVARQDLDAAIQHFNLAWLINPIDGAVYWGLGVATGIRGDADAIVDRYFEKAQSILGDEAHLLVDWGRIYEQRNEYNKARGHFEQAAASDPKDTEPHLGLVRIGQKLGDLDMVKKHQGILYELKK
ncbi:lipopolysaccharide assembly protein LapB [Rhizobium sp. L1K21]|uniref:tetratricopeptide repeat protein n=1 Tax=Rhizobium sp. L1K21 TaxID=2954933 RepID=UPI0020935BD3|nr:tetratricopeptide repeat protein [Rhizobium sp. L1K21]MCO6187212.1 tetratricopeptide repeat protein [Rhizobium sp. L1K21]